ncbi:MAG: spoIIIJ-associated protein [Clostridiales bacterium]|jgi:spoIIIJ-associated protein|nr:spoIIIJ-associated protein [Clostridiales bacterium]MDN5283092.1 spoIIIJ-associated protein [Candidatus Ozemobacter sp.]
MNRTIEITAKSEEEARQIAQGELNDNEVIVNSEVLSAPAKGIFGFVGKQEFKMRFTFGEKPQQTEEKEEEVFQEKRAERPARSERSDYSERSSSRRRDSSERPQRRRQPEEPIPERPKEPLSDEVRNHPSYNEIFELIREIATNLGIDDLELEDYQRDGAWVIEASGENVSQLIGKRGKNLDSVQYLMNIILNRGNEERIKLVLDAQGYREKRYRNLMSLANRMYKKALSSRRSVELEPMSTLDRRTVHMALKDKDGIETFSRGAEPMRRVVISPLKKSRPENNTGWQPIASEEDEIESIERNETSSAVPMFMEEDV